MVHDQKFKIDRVSDRENTSAIFSFSHKKTLAVEEALALTIKAVTKWVQTTDTGKEAWTSSCEDLNIGDLSSYLDDEELAACLKEVGLENLDVQDAEYPVSADIWNFDTVLADSSELAEARV